MNTPADKTAKRLSADETRRAYAPPRISAESFKRTSMSTPADKIARRV